MQKPPTSAPHKKPPTRQPKTKTNDFRFSCVSIRSHRLSRCLPYRLSWQRLQQPTIDYSRNFQLAFTQRTTRKKYITHTFIIVTWLAAILRLIPNTQEHKNITDKYTDHSTRTKLDAHVPFDRRKPRCQLHFKFSKKQHESVDFFWVGSNFFLNFCWTSSYRPLAFDNATDEVKFVLYVTAKKKSVVRNGARKR